MFKKEYIEKIRDLLLSSDEANVILGVQLVSKEFAKELLQDFYALSLLHPSGKTYKKIRKIFKKNAPEEWWKFSIRKRIGEYDTINLVEEKLENFCNYKEIDKKILAWYVLKKIKKGLKFCLKYQVKSEEEVFSTLVEEDGWLDLSDYHFKEFPKAIINIKQITDLDISYNDFTEFPKEIKNFKSLKSIDIKDVPLSEKGLRQIEQLLPKFFAEQYAYSAGSVLRNIIRKYQTQRREEFLKSAKEKLDKAILLDRQNPIIYNNFSAYWREAGDTKKAVEYSKKVLDFDKDKLKIYFYINLASNFLDLKQSQEAYEICEKGMKIFEDQKTTNPQEYSRFYAYKALALFRQKAYQESIEENKKALKLYGNNSMALYNMACAYAMLKDKKLMLDFLEKSIISYENHRLEAPEDEDFKEYWEDEDFKKLTSPKES